MVNETCDPAATRLQQVAKIDAGSQTRTDPAHFKPWGKEAGRQKHPAAEPPTNVLPVLPGAVGPWWDV